MRASIVIVNWNVGELVIQCIDSILRYPPEGDFEIWVVDNASTDGSQKLLAERFPEVHLICNKTNVGFATANNQALSKAVGRHLILLNPDTEVKADALSRLLDFMDSNPRAGAVGPYLLNPDGTLQTSCYPLPTLTREFWRLFHFDRLQPFGVYNMTEWPTDEARGVGVIQGACLVLRRSALQDIGLLDEDYFMYTEEVDLCYRLQHAGWDVCWLPQARVLHYGGQSTRQMATEMFLRLYESKLLFFRKNHGWIAAKFYKGILYFAALGRITFMPLLKRMRPAKKDSLDDLTENYQRLMVALRRM